MVWVWVRGERVGCTGGFIGADCESPRSFDCALPLAHFIMSIAHGIKTLGVIGAGQMGTFDVHDTSLLCVVILSPRPGYRVHCCFESKSERAII